MFTVAIIVVFFAVIQLIVALSNLLFKPNLHKRVVTPDFLVSVLIPARNEENNIRFILNDLISQDYQNIEIIVFDDQSTDHTARIVQEFALTDTRIKLIQSVNLPPGWLGKNFACDSLSKLAKGDYLLFLDADVRVGTEIIRLAISYSEKNNLGLLSIFPDQLMGSAGEKMTVPIMNYILLTLLPLPLVLKSGFSSLAAANGQFMLFNSKIYKRFWLHNVHRKNKVEDIAIARFLKEKQIPIACITGEKSIQCRMYSNFNEAVSGFSKNLTAFFGNSFFLAIMFWVITTFGFIPVCLGLSLKIFVSYLFVLVITRSIVSVTSNQPIRINLIFLIPQQLVIGLIIFRAFTSKYFNHYQWKGRDIV